MDFSYKELADSHLLVVVQSDGSFKWSAKRSDQEVVAMLRQIADDIEQREVARAG